MRKFLRIGVNGRILLPLCYSNNPKNRTDMKRLLLWMLLLCGGLQAMGQQMTVASFNVRYRNDGDAAAGNGWERRCPYVCGLVEFQGFDIFGAQEVLDDQLHDMLDRLPDYNYIGVGRDDGATKGEYAPIFYRKERFELLDEGHFWLSEVTDRPNVGWDAALPRICTWGRFRDRTSGRVFHFFNLHMDHVGVKARAESCRLVLERIRTMCDPGECYFLTGDFNVDQTDAMYALLAESEALRDAYRVADIRYAPNGTFNDFDTEALTDSRIDHVFVSPTVDVVAYGVLTDTYRTPEQDSDEVLRSGSFPKEVSYRRYRARTPSDHFPVVVKVRLGD